MTAPTMTPPPTTLTPEQVAIAEKVRRILFPYASRKAEEITKKTDDLFTTLQRKTL